jgi:SAM-dependent methyltransferase
MSEIFGSAYAEAYDIFYQDKDYTAECELLDRIFRNYGDGAIYKVLDLGCGTGNHAIPLAQLGYQVVGVDRSESMLAHALSKVADLSSDARVSFMKGDIRSFDLKRQFDAALMMFAVLGYQLDNDDIFSALRTARRHLRPAGLLIFDVWYGPAVLNQRPSQRVKAIPTHGGQVLRFASGELDIRRQVCKVCFHVWQLEGKTLVAETEESHWMRYFFPMELELFLKCSGFALIRLGAFPDFDKEPDETTWNVLGVAQAT